MLPTAKMLPRIAVAILCAVPACWFDADYGGGHFTCSDGKCPTGEMCVADACSAAAPNDAARDAHAADASADARQPALTCVDPGALAMTGDTIAATTAGRSSQVAADCGGGIMNGPDAVYRITAAANETLTISIAGEFQVAAYALAPCTAAPATPACEGGSAATPGAPIAITPTAAGDQFIVVDSLSPLGSGAYTLTVSP